MGCAVKQEEIIGKGEERQGLGQICIGHLGVFGPHTALEKWRVEKEHKNNENNVVSWFCLLFLNLGFCHFWSVLSVYPWPWNAHYKQVLKGQLVDKSASLLMG